MMVSQDEEVEEKLRAIQNKIENGAYDVHSSYREEKDKADLFFATEIETDFQQLNKSVQSQKTHAQSEDRLNKVRFVNNVVVSN